MDKQKRETKRPDFCVIEVSHKCMFRCKMCNYWQTKENPREVTIHDLCRFVTALKNFVETPFEMNISGGEPLLKDGVLDLIEFIAHQGFKFSLVTNGFLIDKSTAKRIADSGLNFLAISLDSLNENTHDYLRGIQGAYRKVMEALGYFMAYRGKLQNITLQTIVMGPNLDDILDLVTWAHKQQLSLSFMAVTRPNMVPVDSQWYTREDLSFLWPQDISKVQHILDNLISLKKAGYRIDNPIGQLERFKLYFSDPEKFVRETPCSLGDDFIHVNPYGDIHLCCEMESVGNIKKEIDIVKIWTSKQAQKIRESIRLCKRNCAEMVNCYKEVL
jgi:MoaA/NifB/PqqE/SkfB family radical SAM enzyme